MVIVNSYIETIRWLEAYGKSIIYTDETNINLFCTRHFGRATRGQRVRVPMASSKGRNLHIIGAISANGLVKFTIKRGSFNAELYKEWMRELLRELSDNNDERSYVVVCDNAPCHTHLEEVFHHQDFQLVRLGPYSPALNPIEIIWSVLKSRIKVNMREQYAQILEGDPSQCLSKQEWRMRCLESIVSNLSSCITPTVCANAVKHVQSFYDAALRGDRLSNQ